MFDDGRSIDRAAQKIPEASAPVSPLRIAIERLSTSNERMYKVRSVINDQLECLGVAHPTTLENGVGALKESIRSDSLLDKLHMYCDLIDSEVSSLEHIAERIKLI